MRTARESLRDEALPVFHETGAAALDCFLLMGTSGRRIVDDAGLDPIALDETELLRGRSQGVIL
jgi:hypothetical protein